MIPLHVLLPSVENALNHGLKKSKRRKKISICSNVQNDFLHVEIKDNGCRMSPQKLKILTQSIANGDVIHSYTHTSIGLPI